MANDDEKRIIAKLLQQAGAAQELFNNKGQTMQERTVVHGFLSMLDVPHESDDLVKQPDSLVDVTFHDAAFQVTEILDEGRRRGDELKARIARLQKAECLADLWEEGTIQSTPLEAEELTELVREAGERKAKKAAYKCGGVDLLAYVNLLDRHALPGEYPSVPDLASQSWRSVSVVMECFAVVLYAGDDAPEFLREQEGRPAFRFEMVGGSVFDWPDEDDEALPA